MDDFCWQGAKFPWESAATGREVCPEDIYGAQEIHVTGDVLMAFEQYYHTTQVKVCHPDGPACRASGGGHRPFPEKLCCCRLPSELPVAPWGPFFSCCLLCPCSSWAAQHPLGSTQPSFLTSSAAASISFTSVLLLSFGLVESASW